MVARLERFCGQIKWASGMAWVWTRSGLEHMTIFAIRLAKIMKGITDRDPRASRRFYQGRLEALR